MHPSKAKATMVPEQFASRFQTLKEKGIYELVKKWFIAVGKQDFKSNKKGDLVLTSGAGYQLRRQLSREELLKMVHGLTKKRKWCVTEDESKWTELI